MKLILMKTSDILVYFGQNYCSRAIMALTAGTAFVVSVRYYRRHPSLRIFCYYIAFALLQSASNIYKFVADGSDSFEIESVPGDIAIVVADLFMIFDVLVFSYFIHFCVTGRWRRRIIKINAVLFLCILLLYHILTIRFFFHEAFFYLASIFLMLPCLFYYYELFLGINNKPLKNQPSFWIVTGIFLLRAADTPLLLLLGHLGSAMEAAWALNYILYSIFFILLVRAYRCRPDGQLVGEDPRSKNSAYKA
jgi:hypothetical protein